MKIRTAQVACEIESVEGAAETLEAADAFKAFNPQFTPIIEAHERRPISANMSPSASAPGKRSARLSFDVELVGTAAAGSAIHYSDALLACGVAETLSASTSATYKPATSSIPSVTLGLYMDGKIYTLWGARGTAVLNLMAGQAGILSMDFLAADFSVLDGALLSGVSYNAIMPPTVQGATLTIDSFAAIVESLSIDLGNELVLRRDISSSSGHKSAVINDRRPIMTFNPEEVLVASEDFFGNWRSGAEMALSLSLGSTEGNVIGITAPKVQYQELGMGDRDGLAALDITALLCGNSGDDEWQIQIT